MTAYVYYSYEEWGRGYIGARSKSPDGDDYFGSFKDKTFNPTNKVIIATFDTMEEALELEVLLHDYFDVVVNPHFANRAKQTSTGWTTAGDSSPWSKSKRDSMEKYWDDPKSRRKQSERITGTKKKDTANIKVAVQRRKRAHWTKKLWDEVVSALTVQTNRNWGAADIAEKHGVTLKSVKSIRRLILNGVNFEDATHRVG